MCTLGAIDYKVASASYRQTHGGTCVAMGSVGIYCTFPCGGNSSTFQILQETCSWSWWYRAQLVPGAGNQEVQMDRQAVSQAQPPERAQVDVAVVQLVAGVRASLA
jgi:hypothetical protein